MRTLSFRAGLTVGGLLEDGVAALERGGVADARRDAEVLLGHVLRRGRAWLYAHGESSVSPSAREEFSSLVRKRSAGCPVAYLIGSKEFWSLELSVTPATLIPRPETEHVVEEALRVIDGFSGIVSVWDVGTGCGNIAVALATSVPRLHVLATDRSPSALAVAACNVGRHGVADRVRLIAADLDEPLGSVRFHLVVSNPPYVSADEWANLPRDVRGFEPAEALLGGADGLAVIRRLIDVAPTRLERAGALVLEIGAGMGETLRDLIVRRKGLEFVRITPDYAGLDRVVVARRL